MVDFDDAIALARRTYRALANAHDARELAAVMDQAKEFLNEAGVPLEPCSDE